MQPLTFSGWHLTAVLECTCKCRKLFRKGIQRLKINIMRLQNGLSQPELYRVIPYNFKKNCCFQIKVLP